MPRHSLGVWIQSKSKAPLRIVLYYVLAGLIWVLLSSSLMWNFAWHPAILVSLRVLYFVGSGSILYFLLFREGVLANSRAEYMQLLNNVLEPVFIHQNGLIVEVNRYAIEVLEATTPDDLFGMSIMDVVHPDYRNLVAERVSRLNKGSGTQLQEEKFLTLRGHVIDVEISGIPVQFHGQPAILVMFRDITVRKQAQEAVRASERRLRTLIDAMPDQICFVDGDGRWIEANRAILHATGLGQADFRGKTASELADICNPVHRQDFLKNAYYPPETYDTVTHFSYEHIRPDGGMVASEITRVPVHEADGSSMGLVVIARDVSEQRRATQLLKESEQRYRSLFDNDEDMVVSVDPSGVILSANPSTKTTLGYPPQEIIGKKYPDFIATEDLEEAYLKYKEVMNGRTQVASVRMVRRDGTHIAVAEKKIPILSKDRVTGFYCIVRDVTGQREAEDLLIRAERLSAIGQMAAGIAHEIRNPLTVLKGFVQLMHSSKEHRDDYLEVMKGEFERIESIVNELLVFAKPTRRLLECCDCGDIVRDVLNLMTSQANERNITVSTRIEDGGSHDIMCEKNRIKQVLINVVKNAIEALQKGGNIVIGVYHSADSEVISVRDNGPGIALERMSQIGEPFYTTKESGTGLGLMVSRKILEAHHGELVINSQPGEGTEVMLIIPSSP